MWPRKEALPFLHCCSSRFHRHACSLHFGMCVCMHMHVLWRSKMDVAKAESLGQSLSLLTWLLSIARSLWGAPDPPPFQAWHYRWAMTPIWPLCGCLETQTLVLMQTWQALYLLNHFLCYFIAILDLRLIPRDGYIYTYIHTHTYIHKHTYRYILITIFYFNIISYFVTVQLSNQHKV